MEEKEFIAYEYKEVSIKNEKVELYLDSIKNFGWTVVTQTLDFAKTHLKLKRNYKIANREQIVMLEKKFESAFEILASKDGKEKNKAVIYSISVGLMGTVFMAGSVFSYLDAIIWATIVLAIPGFMLWALAYFVYRKVLIVSKKKLTPMIDQAYSTIFNTTEQAHHLLVNTVK